MIILVQTLMDQYNLFLGNLYQGNGVILELQPHECESLNSNQERFRTTIARSGRDYVYLQSYIPVRTRFASLIREHMELSRDRYTLPIHRVVAALSGQNVNNREVHHRDHFGLNNHHSNLLAKIPANHDLYHRHHPRQSLPLDRSFDRQIVLYLLVTYLDVEDKNASGDLYIPTFSPKETSNIIHTNTSNHIRKNTTDTYIGNKNGLGVYNVEEERDFGRWSEGLKLTSEQHRKIAEIKESHRFEACIGILEQMSNIRGPVRGVDLLRQTQNTRITSTISRATFYRGVQDLTEAGLVIRIRRGTYRLAIESFYTCLKTDQY